MFWCTPQYFASNSHLGLGVYDEHAHPPTQPLNSINNEKTPRDSGIMKKTTRRTINICSTQPFHLYFFCNLPYSALWFEKCLKRNESVRIRMGISITLQMSRCRRLLCSREKQMNDETNSMGIHPVP